MNSTARYANFDSAGLPTRSTYEYSKRAPTVSAQSTSSVCSSTTNSIVAANRLLERRLKSAAFRDHTTLDSFDWKFNPTIDRALVFELATTRFIEKREDCLILGNPGTGKSRIAQGVGIAAIHAGFRVLYREAHVFFQELLLAAATGDRPEAIATYSEVPLLILDDLGMQKPPAAAEDLLEIVMRRYERASTIITSNRPLEDWPKLFGDTPAVAAFLESAHASQSSHRDPRQELPTPRIEPCGPQAQRFRGSRG